MHQRLNVAYFGRCSKALDCMWRVFYTVHSDCLQASELIEDAEELGDAKVLLNLGLANELDIDEDEFLKTASEVLTV